MFHSCCLIAPRSNLSIIGIYFLRMQQCGLTGDLMRVNKYKSTKVSVVRKQIMDSKCHPSGLKSFTLFSKQFFSISLL